MISDDDLLLYYYRELDAAERARIGAAISSDPDLARRLQGLVAHLDAVGAMPELPVPAEVQRRWQAALERAARKNVVSDARVVRPGRFFSGLRWQAVAAAVAVVALAVIVQVSMRPQAGRLADAAQPAAPVAVGGDASAYERGLKWHLASTEQQLADLTHAPPAERARLIEAITAQNRMYALAAERAGEPQLARVLRAFAPILESLAHDGGDSSANIAQLSFELRVMQGRLNASADAPSNTL
jgi:hypothetical protein